MLPTTKRGNWYCITIIDRFTNWPEAVPTADMTAETVARAIYENWICKYGTPIRLTSDLGTNFQSELFSNLLKMLGIQRIRTNPYHPTSNGKIENWHKSLKSALVCRLSNNQSWDDELPTVLLGLRAVPRYDTGISAAEMVFGQKFRLPGDFYIEAETKPIDNFTYVDKLRSIVHSLQPKSSSSNVSM